MPTYEYVCETCKKEFEVEQRISDEPLKTCTKKGCTGRVRRLISGGTGFRLKGSGWFKDGY